VVFALGDKRIYQHTYRYTGGRYTHGYCTTIYCFQDPMYGTRETIGIAYRRIDDKKDQELLR